MEAALERIQASALLVTGSDQGYVLRSDNPSVSQELTVEAADFARLSKLGTNLKMGPIHQTIVVGEDDVKLCTNHDSVVGVVSAPSLDRAILADSLIKQVNQ